MERLNYILAGGLSFAGMYILIVAVSILAGG